ncbi:hypothetical protein LC612_36645 [Nostoc sp. CHAB 5834]|nr:hypothetical protein [Nostoc sp. CHAB 5834]
MSNDELLSKLHQQNVQNTRDRQIWEETITEIDGVLTEAKKVTNFRRYFNWWLKTKEGQAVKEKLFIDQQGKCIKCNGSLQVSGANGVLINHSEVHHLAPLALLQKYAEANPQIDLASLRVFVISYQYLRLVHPLCNKQLGEKIGDLPGLKFLKDFLQEKTQKYD